jgi:hypothetical protein
MKRRPQVPVRLLPPPAELARELHTTEGILENVLRIAAGAGLEDLEAIRTGHGTLRRDVWETVDQWRIDVAEGRRPCCAGHARPETFSDVEDPAAEGLADVLAFLSGVTIDEFKRFVGPRFTKTLTPGEITGICNMISQHEGQLRVYSPAGHFDVGDLLLDADAHDFGAVESMVNGSAMDVTWVRRGKLRMVHR